MSGVSSGGGDAGGGGGTQTGGVEVVSVSPGPLVDIPGFYDIASKSIIPDYIGELIERNRKRMGVAEGGYVKKFSGTQGSLVQSGTGGFQLDSNSALAGGTGLNNDENNKASVMGTLSKFVGDNAPALLTTAVGGLLGLTESGQQQPAGYQGGIPNYKATRSMKNIDFTADRGPGSRGRSYFNDISYGPASATPDPSVTPIQGIGIPQPQTAVDTSAFVAPPVDPGGIYSLADINTVLNALQSGGTTISALSGIYGQSEEDIKNALLAGGFTAEQIAGFGETTGGTTDTTPPSDLVFQPDDTGQFANADIDTVIGALTSGATDVDALAALYDDFSAADITANLEAMGLGPDGNALSPAAPTPTPTPTPVVDPVVGLPESSIEDQIAAIVNASQASMDAGVDQAEALAAGEAAILALGATADQIAAGTAQSDATTLLEGVGTDTAAIQAEIDAAAQAQNAADIINSAPPPAPVASPPPPEPTADEVAQALINGQVSAEEVAAYYQDQFPGITAADIEANLLSGNYAQGGEINQYYLGGSTDGMADDIPAMIGNSQPAALSDGEFVIPADVVSHLGNGNSDAGAQNLYSMMERVRTDRTGNPNQGKQINPNQYLA